MSASKTKGVVLSVDRNVLLVATLKLLDSSLNMLHATFLAHLLGGEVAVKTSSVPITWDWLRVERDLGTELFSDTVEKETGQPEVVTQLNTLAGTNLELPLSWHDFRVGSRNFNTSEQASLEVSLDDISAINLSSTNTTVVWALGAWETVGGPSIWSVGHIEESVFLLKTEPWFVLCVCLHQLSSFVAVVELVGGSVRVPALSDNQDVGGTTEWVGEDSNRSEVNIGVVAWGLAGRASIEVPLREIFNSEITTFWDAGESL